MRVLILGGYGFIGLEAARRLLREHDVTALGRAPALGARLLPKARWIGADIAALDTPAKWAPLLEGVETVVNASGALQDGARDNLTALQDVAIRALIAACEAQGVRRFVQISAPGAGLDARTDFLRTKAVADAALKQSAVPWVILRPGLVWGRTATGGTALVRMLAGVPIVQPLVLAHARVQLVDIDDVSNAIASAVSGEWPAGSDVDLVEPSQHQLHEIVASVRRWHGYSPAAAQIDAPPIIGAALARLADFAGWLGWRSPLRTTSLRALERGVIGDSSAWAALGGAPMTFDESLSRRPATRQDRLFARTQLLLPLIVIGLAAFWIASGVIGLWRLDDAVAAQAGATGLLAGPVAIGGAAADIALGLMLLWRPFARAACFGMIALTTLYLAIGSWLTPQLWVDPLGPFVKTIPAAVLALVCATLLEER